MWRYARGIAQVKRGDFAAAVNEAHGLETLEGADFAVMNAAGIPAKDVVRLAREVVEGRIAQARGDRAAAIASFERAAEIQDGLPYMEPPYWYYPVRQSLAAALLQAGQLDRAEEQFFRALRRAPTSGWATFGLAAVASARGQADEARRFDGDLAKMWIGDRALLTLSAL
jgi:Flp pilus assembly protein TadD